MPHVCSRKESEILRSAQNDRVEGEHSALAMIKHFTLPELAALRRIRERFLHGTAGDADYWRVPADVALYDSTFAERIGWKWDAVLGELRLRGWRPRSRRVLDWGCGSGIAHR